MGREATEATELTEITETFVCALLLHVSRVVKDQSFIFSLSLLCTAGRLTSI